MPKRIITYRYTKTRIWHDSRFPGSTAIPDFPGLPRFQISRVYRDSRFMGSAAATVPTVDPGMEVRVSPWVKGQ